MADILARCRGVARRSPEAHRHTVAGIGVAVITVVAIGAAAIGAATIGVAAIGAIIDLPVISSFSLATLVIRFSTGIPLTGTIRTTTTATAMVTPTGLIITAGPLTDTVTATAIKGMATAIRGTATPIKGTATAVVTAEGPRWCSCSAGWLGQDTITALLMESWDQKRDARFGRTNAATMTASTA